MGARTRISLGVGLLALLLPVQAQAASGRVRLLNAGSAGAVTLVVDGKATGARVAAGAVSRRFAVASGSHTFEVARGTRSVATRSSAVKSGQRLTVVLTVTGGQSVLRLLREPGGVGNGTLVRVANYASRAGTVDVRVGALTIARALGVGHTSIARRVTAALSPTGTIRVSARRTRNGTTFTASEKLVLATRTVGLFALVPNGSSARLIRLPYDVTPPSPRRLPAVTGTRRFNHTVTCGRGAWTPTSARISRRWTVDGVPRGGGATLRLSTAADAGHVLGCAVSATSHGMTTRVRTSFALPSVPTPIVAPAILVPGGELQVGDIATCDVGKWAGGASAFAFRWVRVRDRQVLGAQSTYAMTLADNGLNNVVACLVTATNDGGTSRASESLNTVALNIPPTISIRTGPTRPVEGPTTFAFFTFAIGGGGANTVTGTFGGNPVACDRFGCQVNFLFNDGPNAIAHSFTATATNGAGSASTPPWSWSVNPPLPLVTQVMGPSDHALDTVTFTWNATGGGIGGSAECSIDDGAFAPCTGGDATSAVVTFDQPAPADGITHKILIRSRNAGGVSQAAQVDWPFLPPPVTISSVDISPGNLAPAGPITVTVVTNAAPAHVMCSVDGAAPKACGPSSSTPLPDPGPGPHSMVVTASNARGTFQAMPTLTWSYA